MTPAFFNRLWLAVLAGLVILLLCSLTGCAGGPAPRAIALPTTAAVRAPILAASARAARASASNARASKLAATAVEHGIRAGSEEARDLAVATGETTGDLAEVLVQLSVARSAVDQLTAQLLAAQTRVNALARDDAAQRTRAAREEIRADRLEHDLVLLTLFTVLSDAAVFVVIGFAGEALEKMVRAVAAVALAALSTGFHFVLGLFLRFWPLLLAAI